ncbi:hypothetical protein BC827DRAFT_266726 [Russula dissimulans]|nr:hypothetical protein BC827DRAFT_266726 [Russula dissimulans]
MDSFINIAKQGFEAYQSSQGNQGQQSHQSHGGDDPTYRRTGGEEYNAPHYPQGGGYSGPQIDHDEAVRHAQTHGSGDSSLFSSALSFVHQNPDQHGHPIDEEAVQQAHRQAYEEGNARGLPASSLGSAAALQVLQKFTSGGGSSGGGSQTQLISLAMAEASKLFDQSGGSSSGGKQEAVNGAAMTIAKLFLQGKFGGAIGGGNSGGLGGLLSLASKFA